MRGTTRSIPHHSASCQAMMLASVASAWECGACMIRFCLCDAAALQHHPSIPPVQVPELLFRPMDIGLQQAGVAEAVVQAVSAAHPALQPLLYTNVVLTGVCRGRYHWSLI